jgi:hypothetical protein
MDSPTHYYDPRLRGIPCGASGPDVHSTKHARAVTCRSCLQALRDKPPGDGPRAEGSPAPAP